MSFKIRNAYDIQFPFKALNEVQEPTCIETELKSQQMTFLNMFFTERLLSLSDESVASKIQEIITEAIIGSHAYAKCNNPENALWHYLAFNSLEVLWNSTDERRQSLVGKIPLCLIF